MNRWHKEPSRVAGTEHRHWWYVDGARSASPIFLDGQLHGTADSKDAVQHAWVQGECAMASIVNVVEAKNGSMVGFVEWKGFGRRES